MKIIKILYNSKYLTLCVFVLLVGMYQNIFVFSTGIPGWASSKLNGDERLVYSLVEGIVSHNNIQYKDFYHEYAPGFHYIISIFLRLLGPDILSMRAGVMSLSLIAAPLLAAFVTYSLTGSMLIALLVNVVFIAFESFVQVKGTVLLVGLALLLRRHTLKSLFYAPIICGFLFFFAQEYSIACFVGLVVLKLFLNTSNDRRFNRLGYSTIIQSTIIYILTIASIVILWSILGRTNVYTIVRYLIIIPFGAQAKFMTLPFCFDCGTIINNDLVRKLVLGTGFPILYLVVLARYSLSEHNWKRIYIGIVSTICIATALGRADSVHISAGQVLLPILIADFILLLYRGTFNNIKLHISDVLIMLLQVTIIVFNQRLSPLQVILPFFALLTPSLIKQSRYGINANIFIPSICFLVALALIYPVTNCYVMLRDALKADGSAIKSRLVTLIRNDNHPGIIGDEYLYELMSLVDIYVPTENKDKLFVIGDYPDIYPALNTRNPLPYYYFPPFFSEKQMEDLIEKVISYSINYIIIQNKFNAPYLYKAAFLLGSRYKTIGYTDNFRLYQLVKGSDADGILVSKYIDFFETFDMKRSQYGNYLKKNPALLNDDFIFMHPPFASCIRLINIPHYEAVNIKGEVIRTPMFTDSGIFRITDANGVLFEDTIGESGKLSFEIRSLCDLNDLRIYSALEHGTFIKLIIIPKEMM